MKRVFEWRIIRIVTAMGGALVLIALVLSTLIAMAKPTQANDSVKHSFPKMAATSSKAAQLPTVLTSRRDTVITTTSLVITQTPMADPAWFPGQPLPEVPPARGSTSLVSLPEQVVKLLDVDNLQSTNTDVEFVKVVQISPTRMSSGESIAMLGQTITYVIGITAMSPISNILIVDQLPKDVLANVLDCRNTRGTCNVIAETTTFTDPFNDNNIVELKFPRIISASINTLNKSESAQIIFSGTVTCQPNDSFFNNQAAVSYNQNGSKLAQSNLTTTTIRAHPEPGNGQTKLSNASTWCSEEPGGTYGLDWGDFDLDGDLDLALGSTAATVVYRNDDSKLTRFWGNDRFTFDVHWANVDKDDQLELLAVSKERQASFFNGFSGYVYKATADGFIQKSSFAEGKSGLLRIASADYDLDDDLEVVLLSYLDSCGIFFYENNNGTGEFVPDLNNSDCLATTGARSIAWGDHNNDGYPDLAVGKRGIEAGRVFENDTMGRFTTSNYKSFEDESVDIYDLAWGDYDNDGNVDLVAGISCCNPWDSKAIIYRNDPSMENFDKSLLPIDATGAEFTVGVDWADFTGDGLLDLIVADREPKIYENAGSPSFSFSKILTISDFINDNENEIWRVRGADQDNDGDMDVVIGNRNGQVMLFTTFARFLNPTLTEIEPPFAFSFSPANSVAWGDVDNDRDFDLLFGAGPQTLVEGFNSKLYKNINGEFSKSNLTQFGQFGPHVVAMGDMNDNNQLDITVGKLSEVEFYLDGNTVSPLLLSLPANTSSLAWGDADFDDNKGALELLVATEDGPIVYTLTETSPITTTPLWGPDLPSNSKTVAWGYFDSDRYLDFAVGGVTATYVYRNNGNYTFTPVWSNTHTYDTRSIAWGDYDQDGDLDLAVGNYNGPAFIYENAVKVTGTSTSTTLSKVEVWSTTETLSTTSLAWGDWNNDGDLDLALGNYNKPDRVYDNTTPESGQPQFTWLWKSAKEFKTTGIAWGDRDGDGDLDLAISQDGNANNGYYENNYSLPAHIESNFAKYMPLPNNPTYVSVAKPGQSGADFFYGSAELLSGAAVPTVAIKYKLFDPDGTRQTSAITEGDKIASTYFEYSLNGGYSWHEATPHQSSEPVATRTLRLGNEATFIWDAQEDKAISDNARFRISVIFQDEAGPVQRASTQAVSPPFRVRGLKCEWPDGISIKAEGTGGSGFKPGEPIRFTGILSEGSGVITYSWNFGDGTVPQQGPVVQHTYETLGFYWVTLTVDGEPCPLDAEPISAIIGISVGFTPTNFIHLPLVQKSGPATQPTSSGPVLQLASIPDAPAQVTGLSGQTDVSTGVTKLMWRPSSPDEAVRGYRIYRANVSEAIFHLLAEVPSNVISYTDNTSTCRQMYLITAFNDTSESLPSTASYFSLPCR